MPELLTPGVFIQEIDFGPQPIEGVSTSTAGFVGETERGTAGVPTLVTSLPDYQRKFGGFVTGKVLPLAVRGFFDNGGRRAFIVRVVGGGATPALRAQRNVVSGYEVALLAAPQAAPTANQFNIRVGSVVGIQKTTPTAQQLVAFPLSGGTGINADILSINATAGTVLVGVAAASSAAFSQIKPDTHAIRYQTAVGTTTILRLQAKDQGAYANNRLKALLTPKYLATATVLSTTTTPGVLNVSNINAFKPNITIEFEKPTGERNYEVVTSVDLAANTITTPATTQTTGDTIRVTGYRLDVVFDGNAVETIDGITSRNDGPDGLGTFINTRSNWIRVDPALTPTLAIDQVTLGGTISFPLFKDGAPADVTGGTDGTVDALAIIGTETAGNRTGLKALEAQEGISIIAAPGQTSDAVIGELIGQAERQMDRFAVFESNNQEDIQQVLTVRGKFNSRFGAMYHPWVQILDPLTGTTADVPPAGHILGAYARTDNERGVFKAPANVTLRGIIGISRNVPDGEQDLLNPAGVNVLREFEGLGRVIWGARTISAEGLWKYVPVRRLFIFIEQSIVKGTRFAVFEPNDLRLWARLRDAVTNFLTTQWRAGALFGAKPEEAFFVKVDETTTTQDDRDNGRVNIIVGIAPVKPAEFIVFLIGQAPQSVIISEQG